MVEKVEESVVSSLACSHCGMLQCCSELQRLSRSVDKCQSRFSWKSLEWPGNSKYRQSKMIKLKKVGTMKLLLFIGHSEGM
jgi:hypothetical protein